MELITNIQSLFQVFLIITMCLVISVLAVILTFEILKVMKKILLFMLDCFAPILGIILFLYIFLRGAIAVTYNRIFKT